MVLHSIPAYPQLTYRSSLICTTVKNAYHRSHAHAQQHQFGRQCCTAPELLCPYNSCTSTTRHWKYSYRAFFISSRGPCKSRQSRVEVLELALILFFSYCPPQSGFHRCRPCAIYAPSFLFALPLFLLSLDSPFLTSKPPFLYKIYFPFIIVSIFSLYQNRS